MKSKYTYHLTDMRAGSEKYGACEVCGKNVKKVYYAVEVKSFTRPDGTEGTTHRKCFDKFGHKECLVKWRGRYSKQTS